MMGMRAPLNRELVGLAEDTCFMWSSSHRALARPGRLACMAPQCDATARPPPDAGPVAVGQVCGTREPRQSQPHRAVRHSPSIQCSPCAGNRKFVPLSVRSHPMAVGHGEPCWAKHGVAHWQSTPALAPSPRGSAHFLTACRLRALVTRFMVRHVSNARPPLASAWLWLAGEDRLPNPC